MRYSSRRRPLNDSIQPFCLATEPGGYSERYSGSLPAAISPEDSRQDVQRKLGVSPVASGYSTLRSRAYPLREVSEDSYAIPPFELKFSFNAEDDKLNTFTVRYEDEHMPPGIKSTIQYKEATSSNLTRLHRANRKRGNRHRRIDNDESQA